VSSGIEPALQPSQLEPLAYRDYLGSIRDYWTERAELEHAAGGSLTISCSCPMEWDGVQGLNQPHIKPGETFAYEFTLRQSGTQLYHPHADETLQMALGMEGFFIIGTLQESARHRCPQDRGRTGQREAARAPAAKPAAPRRYRLMRAPAIIATAAGRRHSRRRRGGRDNPRARRDQRQE
jgi:hypothetical protein